MHLEKKLTNALKDFVYWIVTSRLNRNKALKFLDFYAVVLLSFTEIFNSKKKKDRFHLLEVLLSLGSLLTLRAIQCVFLELGLE
jgi:hypothetical protein